MKTHFLSGLSTTFQQDENISYQICLTDPLLMIFVFRLSSLPSTYLVEVAALLCWGEEDCFCKDYANNAPLTD